jgi:hypothetical protein
MIILKNELVDEPGAHSRIRIHELLHLQWIDSRNDDKRVAMSLRGGQEGLNRFAAKIIADGYR